MKLIFMGTPEFALPTLRTLAESKHEIIAVYSQPPRPSGRGQKLTPSPIHQFAEARGIPVYTPTSLKAPEVQQEFASHQADAAIVAAYGLLLPKPILDAPKKGCINIHPSLLPRWRGAAPIQRTIMAGDNETAICIMQMEAGLDSGPILMQQNVSLPPDITAGQLHDQMAKLGAELLLKTLDQIVAGTAKATSQSSEGITYAEKIKKEECQLDFSKTAIELERSIRGLNPSPGAYFIYGDERIKILKARVVDSVSQKSSGTIDSDFTIHCKDGALKPLILQRSGKKPQPLDEFLRGYNL